MVTFACILGTLTLGRMIFLWAGLRHEFLEVFGFILQLVSTIALAGYLIVGVTARFVTGPIFIAEFRSVKQSVQKARVDGEGLEDAALQQKVVEINRELAHEQWWRESDIGFFLPPEIEDLEPIE